MSRIRHAIYPVLIITTATALALSCGSRPKVERVSTSTVTDLSGRWNDTDSRQVSEQMINEMLDNPWYLRWTQDTGKAPVIVVGRIANDTMEHINTGAFVSDLERTLINSGKIAFAGSDSDRDAVRRERLDQLKNASEETIKEFGREIGADFMLFGSVVSFVDQAGGKKAVTYQVDMYLVDIEKNLKSWAGQKKIKKIITRSRMRL